MAGITQERCAGRHGLQNPSFLLLSQILLDVTCVGDQPHQGLGLMRVELIHDKEPRGLRISRHSLGDMRCKVFLGSAWSYGGRHPSPVATSKLAIKHCVPWRRYAYSGRSTRPGCIGNVGAARSNACIPVFSSVLMTCSPCWATTGACWYTAQTAATWAANATGSSGLALSQYSTRWGWRST